MKLFVIGNGFDIAHGLSTSYYDFKSYIENTDWDFLSSIEGMPYTLSLDKSLWSNFEKNLAAIDEEMIVEDCMQTVNQLNLEVDYMGIEDTLSMHWKSIYGFISRLNELVGLWIESTDISTQKITNIIDCNRDDIFLTFNYTSVLEEIYSIDVEKILHIHGSVDDKDDNPPCMGHCESQKAKKMSSMAEKARNKLEEAKASIYSAIAKYYSEALKDTHTNINSNGYFFKKLESIEEIFIVGHSLGEVDMPYFKEIKNSTKDDVKWNAYYYDPDDRRRFREKISRLGVPSKNINILSAENFFNI